MAIAPRTSKELLQLLLQDPEIKGDLHNVVVRVDRQIKSDLTAALKNFLYSNQVDLRLLSNNDITTALESYYKKISLVGQFVKMY